MSPIIDSENVLDLDFRKLASQYTTMGPVILFLSLKFFQTKINRINLNLDRSVPLRSESTQFVRLSKESSQI